MSAGCLTRYMNGGHPCRRSNNRVAVSRRVFDFIKRHWRPASLKAITIATSPGDAPSATAGPTSMELDLTGNSPIQAQSVAGEGEAAVGEAGDGPTQTGHGAVEREGIDVHATDKNALQQAGPEQRGNAAAGTDSVGEKKKRRGRGVVAEEASKRAGGGDDDVVIMRPASGHERSACAEGVQSVGEDPSAARAGVCLLTLQTHTFTP
jgi:hypothetical protein